MLNIFKGIDRASLATTSFWITAAGQVGIVGAVLAGALTGPEGVAAAVISAVAYTVARTITKYRADFKRGYHTTEFYVALAATALAGAETLQGQLPGEQTAAVLLILGTVYKLSRALTTTRLVDEV